MHRFDEVAKALARGLTRRESLRAVGGGLAGALLAAVGLGKAWGAPALRKIKNPHAQCQQFCRDHGANPGGGNCHGTCVSSCEACVNATDALPCDVDEETCESCCCPEGTFCVAREGVCCEQVKGDGVRPIGRCFDACPCDEPCGENCCCPTGLECVQPGLCCKPGAATIQECLICGQPT